VPFRPRFAEPEYLSVAHIMVERGFGCQCG
jgi:hypothetical protein